ncbi:hypothetical protein D9757_013588 [Collybiopsis confluens]|uniref:Uncharacterized protein n=1 Tax=Collybiopsis confluens TaxID=2823264 RepID=A0A8H5GK45_9AGAR|nr:hypothetical protein D9757_013588 [Collybiopsis confluens]
MVSGTGHIIEHKTTTHEPSSNFFYPLRLLRPPERQGQLSTPLEAAVIAEVTPVPAIPIGVITLDILAIPHIRSLVQIPFRSRDVRAGAEM